MLRAVEAWELRCSRSGLRDALGETTGRSEELRRRGLIQANESVGARCLRRGHRVRENLLLRGAGVVNMW
jgi:hypothetical protein